MVYTLFLSLHSLFRWVVLAAILLAVFRAYRGWLGNKPFTKFDNLVRHTTATLAHIQLVFGLTLYFISPVVHYFLTHYHDALHQRELRFFGMEHSSMMLLAILLITLGSAFAKRKVSDKDKFKTIAIWYTIALFIILLNIPWAFSPIVARPYWRTF
ncbi:MAG TPA: hypothetical protein VG603_04730 [Chitinophagales bacterium]|nr:hypothetical protein [Chitinophagales bacterium]